MVTCDGEADGNPAYALFDTISSGYGLNVKLTATVPRLGAACARSTRSLLAIVPAKIRHSSPIRVVGTSTRSSCVLIWEVTCWVAPR